MFDETPNYLKPIIKGLVEYSEKLQIVFITVSSEELSNVSLGTSFRTKYSKMMAIK